MKSKNEEFCRVSFDNFLQKAAKPDSIQWEHVAQQDEPPDYFLYLDNTRYAVEVTVLVEKHDVGNLKISQIGILATLHRLVEEVESAARGKNYLNGAYIVKFSRPINNFQALRKQLFNELLSYVEATQNVSKESELIIFKQHVQKCSIQKLHNQKNYIGVAGPNIMKWEGEAMKEICALLEERITDKHHKLRNIGVPKILLLYDAYHFAEPHMFKSCLNDLKSPLSFHTVFVVESDEPGWILYSETLANMV